MSGPGKDFNGIFKAERENYEILNWSHHLEDVEDALIAKYKGKPSLWLSEHKNIFYLFGYTICFNNNFYHTKKYIFFI